MALGVLALAALGALITVLACCCLEKKKQKKRDKYAKQDMETAKIPLKQGPSASGAPAAVSLGGRQRL